MARRLKRIAIGLGVAFVVALAVVYLVSRRASPLINELLRDWATGQVVGQSDSVYALHVGASRNDLLFFQMLLGAGALLVAAATGVVAGLDQVVIAVFCFWYLAQAVFLNHFWTFSGDYFDAPTFKRLVPYFTVGSSLGGVAGGLVALGLARLASPVALVVGWGVALVGAAVLLRLSRPPTLIRHSSSKNPAQITVQAWGPAGEDLPERALPQFDAQITQVRVWRKEGALNIVLDLQGNDPPEYTVHEMADWIMIRFNASQS